jgi:hypothetical protein
MELTPAGPPYLLCTCTMAFCRFWSIEPIESSKSFEKVDDRGGPTPAASTVVAQGIRRFSHPLLASRRLTVRSMR